MPSARPVQRGDEVRGLSPGEIHEVGLAHSLARRRVVRGGAIAHEHGLHLRAEIREMHDPHRSPALEDVLAIGVRSGGQDHDARPIPAGGREQGPVELLHRGQELAGTDERHGTVHRRESTREDRLGRRVAPSGGALRHFGSAHP